MKDHYIYYIIFLNTCQALHYFKFKMRVIQVRWKKGAKYELLERYGCWDMTVGIFFWNLIVNIYFW